jgi:hypothetical protein
MKAGLKTYNLMINAFAFHVLVTLYIIAIRECIFGTTVLHEGDAVGKSVSN